MGHLPKIDFRFRFLKPATMKNRNKTQRELARQYGVDERTIRNWQDLDAPLDNDDQMRDWIEDRRSGTRYDSGDTGASDFADMNPLRIVVELAGADFLRHAMEHTAGPLVRLLEDEKGLSRHAANGIVMYLHTMLTEASRQWANEAAYEPTLKACAGFSIDGLFKRLVPGSSGRSRPTNAGSMVQPGPKLTAVFEANGAGKLPKRPWVVVDADA